MQVVLVRPPVLGPKNFPLIADLGLLYLAKALRQAGTPVAVRDGWLESDHRRALALDLVEHGPVLVGFKLFSLSIGTVRAAAAEIKKANPQAVIAVGGPHPSGVGAGLWDDVPEADYGMAGEGELGLPLLARALDEGAPAEQLAQIPGLIWRHDGKTTANPPAFVPDLDALDQPAWDAVPVAGYLGRPTPIRKQPHLSILTSRGCPFDCTYCAGRLITGRRMRLRTPELVVAEMQRLRREYGVTTFAVTDDNFTLVREHVERFCRAVTEGGGLRWDCLATGLRPATLDAELLRLMERAGCYAVSVATESGSARILDHMRKQTTLEKQREAIRLVRRETRMRINTYHILGYPAETRADVRSTIRFARRCAAHHALFFLFTPLPGAPITAQLAAEGRLPHTRWEDFQYDRPSIALADVSLKGLKRLQIWATLSFYFGRPRRLLGLLRDLWSPAVLRDFVRRVRSLSGR